MSDAIIVVGREELRELVRDAVREAMCASPARSGEWLTTDGVADLLGYKRSYISELVRRRGLPVHRVGRLFRFRRDEVEAWAEAQAPRR